MNKLVVVGDELAKELAKKIKGKYIPVEERTFPDGEIKPKLKLPIGQRSSVGLKIKQEEKFKTSILIFQKKEKERINDYLIKFFLLSRKLKDCSKKVIGIMPYLPYSRQDKLFQEGEPLSAKYIAEVLEGNLDVFITVNMHEHRRTIKDNFSIPAYNLSIFGLAAKRFLTTKQKGEWIAVGPDKESERFVKDFIKERPIDYVIFSKQRNVKTGEVSFISPKKDFKGKKVIILDDIASSGLTLIKVAKLIKKMGAESVGFIICHGLFIEGALKKLRKLDPFLIAATNTVANPIAVYNIIDVISPFLKEQGEL
ncbi:MAG: ribose-phosphate diphosphokinase [Candidatus Liptonbacteria bacterium]|nr:ribose-phosphate diphosphokinase [Candidatus Liptonbacteria bacterium]